MKSAQAAVRQLALPWAQLIDSLERAAMKEVALLNIQPDAQNRVLRVTAEARRQEQMLDYLRRLSATGLLFLGQKGAPERRFAAEQAEEVG